MPCYLWPLALDPAWLMHSVISNIKIEKNKEKLLVVMDCMGRAPQQKKIKFPAYRLLYYRRFCLLYLVHLCKYIAIKLCILLVVLSHFFFQNFVFQLHIPEKRGKPRNKGKGEDKYVLAAHAMIDEAAAKWFTILRSFT